MKKLCREKFLRTAAAASSVLAAVCLLFFFSVVWENYSRMRYAERLAEEVLRFHIIANSDSEEDQALKLAVRDALISYMASYSDSFTDADAAARFAAAHCDELEEIAASVMESAGCLYPVRASVGLCRFPDKTYDGLCFPAGVYNALRVEIGQAQGQNWWCVLYPPLCFTEEGSAAVPESSREQLKERLSDEDYERLQNADPGRPQIRLRLFDWLFGR